MSYNYNFDAGTSTDPDTTTVDFDAETVDTTVASSEFGTAETTTLTSGTYRSDPSTYDVAADPVDYRRGEATTVTPTAGVERSGPSTYVEADDYRRGDATTVTPTAGVDRSGETTFEPVDVDETRPVRAPTVPETRGPEFTTDPAEADVVGVDDDLESPEDFGGVGTVVSDSVSRLTGDETGAFGEEGISPGAAMSLDDPEAIEARAEQEQEILGWRDIDGPADAPRAAVGGLFGIGQTVERAGVETGEWLSDAIPSAEVGPQIGEEHVGEVPAHLVGGGIAFGGMGLGAVGQLPGSALADVETQLEGEETPTDIEGGTGSIAQTFGATQVEMFRDYPISTAAGFALPTAAGVPATVRGYRATEGTQGRVRWDEITDEAGAAGDLPHFDTATSAPTGRAISELEGRMEAQPDVIRQQADGGVLFHTTGEPFGRGRFEIGEGASEYPGLFTSPEASPLGLRERGVSRPSDESGLSFGLGDYSFQPEAAPGFRPRGLDAIPSRAAEPGYAVRDPQGNVVETGLSRAEANRIADEVGGDRVPDPTTRGYEFMFEEAPTETGMVRPPGDRTAEMEAILPPDSQFQRAGAVGVEMPDGRTIRSDIYQPFGEPARGPDARRADPDGPVDPPITAREIRDRVSEPTRQPDVTAESVFGATTAVGDPTPTDTAVTEPTPTDPFAIDTESAPTVTTRDGPTTPTGTDPAGTRTDPGPTSGGPFDGWVDRGPPVTPTETVAPTSPTEGPPATTTGPAGSPTPTEGVPSYSAGDRYTGVFGLDVVPTETRAPPRHQRRRDGEELDDPEAFDDDELDPETPLFWNPIADVWDGDVFGGGEDLGPFE